MDQTSETQNPAGAVTKVENAGTESAQAEVKASEAPAETQAAAEPEAAPKPQRGAHGLPVGSQVPLTVANAEARKRDRERADEANDLAEATAKMIRTRGKRGGGRRERKDLRG